MEENFNVRAQTSPKGKCVTWSMGFITDKVNWCSLFVRINKSLIITLNCHYYVGAPPTKYVQNRISFSVGWLHLNWSHNILAHTNQDSGKGSLLINKLILWCQYWSLLKLSTDISIYYISRSHLHANSMLFININQWKCACIPIWMVNICAIYNTFFISTYLDGSCKLISKWQVPRVCIPTENSNKWSYSDFD
jgi:hypothetical protein